MDTASGDSDTISLPEQPVTALARTGSRAVVVGTGTHAAGSALAPITAVAATVTAVRDALRNQCGMGESHIFTVTDPESPQPFLASVSKAAAQAEDVLLLYYIGHGLVSLDENELFLATSATTDQDDMLPVEALPFAAVRGVLSKSRARHVAVVLDCCFSGRGYVTVGRAVADAFELMNDRGSYLLSATSPNELALAPEGESYTAFSGALVKFLIDGDRAAPHELTLDHAYRYLTRTLPPRGAPAPQRRVGGDAGALVVAVNPQAPPIFRNRSGSSGPTEATLSEPAICPYPGLDAFTAGQARYFHGRERLVSEILRVLAANRHGGPLAVVGRSGAGKSSLLQAGLLPAIKDGRLDVPGSRHWQQLVMRPGEHPLQVLNPWLAAGAAPDGLIVCVDQFEEVFTACRDEAERRAFIGALCGTASNEGTPPVQVILGLRADFYGRCLDYSELAPMVAAGQVPVRPMRRQELRSAIEKPARAAGLQLDEGLTGRLLRDLDSAEGPGRDVDSALPLLAFALQATWLQSDKRALTLSDYEATGGIWGAVTRRAGEVYEDLGPAQDAAKLLLLSMVQLGDGTDDVRCRVNVDDLLAGRSDDEHDAIMKALNAFVAARLVTLDDGTAEIAHEALLRAWHGLRQWIADDREELLDHQRLAEAARLWKSSGGPVYTGARLDEARKRLDEKPGQARHSLSSLEQGFVRASVRAARNRRKRQLSLATAVIITVLGLVTGGFYAVKQRAGKQQSQAVESSVQLAQEADSLRASDPAGAMWLSLTAYRSYPTPQARTALYNSYSTPYPLALPDRGNGAVVSVAYSPDGSTVAAAWADGSVRLWNVNDPSHPVLAAAIDPGQGSGLAYSPDGAILAVRTARSLQLWKVAGGLSLLSSTPAALAAPGSAGRRWPVAFGHSASIVATAEGNGRVALWDVADPRHPARAASLPALGAAVNAIAFSRDGTMLAVVGGRRVRLWDTADPGRPVLRAALAARSALSAAFSPDGQVLAVGGSDEGVSLWDTAGHGAATVATANEVVANPYGDIDSIAFRPDDNDVFVTTDTAGQTEIWLAAGGLSVPAAQPDGLPDAARPDTAAFSPGGGHLVTGDRGGTAEIWILPAPLLTGTVDTSASISNVSPVNQNGTLLVTDALSGTNPDGSAGPVELWDVADPAHPSLAATLPQGWVSGGFLPDGRTLYTGNQDEIRLWDVADPRHPRAMGTVPAGDWTAGNGLLLAWNPAGPSVRLWDIRDISRPVLDATLRPAQPVTLNGGSEVLVLFPGNLAGVSVGNVLQLWNVSDPHHPVREGELPFDANTAWTSPPSDRQVVMGSFLGPAAVWNLAGGHAPDRWVNTIGIDARTGVWVNDHSLVGLTSQDTSLGLWDVRYPAPPVPLAILPLESGFTAGSATSIAFSPGRRLLATGISTSQGNNDSYVQIWQSAADARSLSQYAQLGGDSGNFALAPDGGFLAMNLDTRGGQLNAFASQPLPNGSVGIVYPLGTDAIYTQLCSVARQTPVRTSWREYLPETYYRPAC